MNRIFLSLALLVCAACAVELPAPASTITVDGASIPLQGEGIRKDTLFAVKIYQAALYSSKVVTTLGEALSDPGPKRLEFRYYRDFSLEETVKAWRYQFRESSGLKPEELESEMALLASFQKPIHERDTQAFLLRDETTIFSINGVEVGEISGAKFQKALLTVFLGPNPPTKELRAGLLREKEQP